MTQPVPEPPDWAGLGVGPRRARPANAARAAIQVLWSLATTAVAAGIGIWLVDGVSVDRPATALTAVAVIALLDALIKPALRRIAGLGGAIPALLLGVVVQITLVTVGLAVTPGVTVSGWRSAGGVMLIAAAVLAIGRWLLGASDSSYVVGYALRRGGPGSVVRGLRSARTADPDQPPGLLIVQLDGVSPGVLDIAIASGLAPNLCAWLDAGTHKQTSWWACVPCTTPASMAGLMHGDRDTIPAFRWWHKELGRLIVTNRPADAALVEDQLATGAGLVSGGVAISTMFSGEAQTSLLVMSKATSGGGLGPGNAFISFFASASLLPSAMVLSIGEMVKELYQGRRQRVRDVRPRVPRHGPYVALRGITNVLMRKLNLSLVAEQMSRGVPVIYVDMVDYDEIAHHAGPLRPEAMRALEGLDAILGQLQQVAARVSTHYALVVLSDHGQSLGPTFEQLNGRPLSEVVRALMGENAADLVKAEAGEQWGPLNTLVTSVLGGMARESSLVLGPNRATTTTADVPEVAVIASGNLGMVWFPRLPGRVGLGVITSTWPGLVEGLLLADGMGLVMVATDTGPVVFGPHGSHDLAGGTISGADPLAGYPGRAAADLLRLSGLTACGDIVVISAVSANGQVHAFESLVGSHGGLGGQQNDGLLIHPAAWTVDDDLLDTLDGERHLIGAWTVHEQLMRWRSRPAP